MNGLPINSFIEALGWMLLHFVWQGAAIAAALWCLLRLAQNSSAQFRYGAACAALLLMLTMGLATFVWAFDVQNAPARRLTSAAALDVVLPVREASPLTSDTFVALPINRETADQTISPTTEASVPGISALAGRLRPWLPWIVGLWVIGVTIHSLRFFVGWRVIRGMRAEGRELEDALWIERFDCLRKRLGVSSGVRLLVSATATVPMVIGCLKPVVLVPTSLLTGLTTSQVEAILMHELTHIRRHDYLVNFLQNMVETLFFYHPALWWVSAQVRQEREHCCDDVASASCGNSVEYARALTALEEFRGAPAASIVAASGGSLLNRVRRLGIHQPAPNRALWPVSVLAVLMLMAVTLPLAALRATEAAQQETAEQEPQKPNAAPDGDAPASPGKILQLRATVIDDETGEPVSPFIIQGGKFDLADPKKVTWGFSEQREDSLDSRCSFGVNWAEGWTARILADGYLPQPVITDALPADQESIEVTIRLKRGRLVRGQVLDHTGQGVSGASVFAVGLVIGPTKLILYGGKAWSMHGALFSEESGQAKVMGNVYDSAAKPVLTDDDGRFEIQAGAAKSLAVSCAGLDAWVSPLPEAGDALIQLPAPARIEISYDIQDGEAEGHVFCSMRSQDMPGFEGVESYRLIPIKNGGQLVLPAMTPGKYLIYRRKEFRIGRSGVSAPLDKEIVELKPGETKTIRYGGGNGAQLNGKITWPQEVKLEGIVVSVLDEKKADETLPDIFRSRYAFQKADDDGNFLTERIPPGRYRLLAEGYTMSDDPKGSIAGVFGFIGPYTVVSYRAETIVDVPQSGELVVPDLMLKTAE